jgi:flagellum-specific peptidoglycan hydrolase FlgJ
MPACEAALESGYGRSQFAVQDRNLFGMKQHLHPIYGTHSLPTRKFLGNEWVTINSNWITYPDWQSCFADRMATLKRLAPVYPHYAAALAAASDLKLEPWVLESEMGNSSPAWVHHM